MTAHDQKRPKFGDFTQKSAQRPKIDVSWSTTLKFEAQTRIKTTKIQIPHYYFRLNDQKSPKATRKSWAPRMVKKGSDRAAEPHLSPKNADYIVFPLFLPCFFMFLCVFFDFTKFYQK